MRPEAFIVEILASQPWLLGLIPAMFGFLSWALIYQTKRIAQLEGRLVRELEEQRDVALPTMRALETSIQANTETLDKLTLEVSIWSRIYSQRVDPERWRPP